MTEITGAKIWVEIGARVDDLKAGLAQAKKLTQDFGTAAESMTRNGADFRKILPGIDDYIGRLKAATPQNAKMAAGLAEISQAFEKGEISASSAASQLERLKNENMSFTDQMKASWKDIAMIGAAAGVAIAAVGKAYQSTVGEAAKYDLSIRDLAQNIGTTTEEASRLVQTMDDFGVGAKEVETAFEMMTKRGLAPSIESLAQLADQYNAIDDPVERAALMADKLGRNWAALTPALRAGGDAIRAGAAAIGDSLIVTSDAAQKAREYQIALDNLGDAWTGLKMKVGNGLMPMMTDLINPTNEYSEALKELGKGAVNLYGAGAKGLSDEVQARMEAIRHFNKMDLEVPVTITAKATYQNRQSDSQDIIGLKTEGADYKESLKLIEVQGQLKDSMEELTLFMAGPVGDENERYAEQQEKLTEQAGEFQYQIDQLSKKTWLSEAQRKQLEDLRGKLGETNAAISATEAAHDKASKTIMFNLLQMQLSADGLTTAEMGLLTKTAEAWGLVDKATVDAFETTSEYVERLAALQQQADALGVAITSLPGYKLITIEIQQIGSVPNIGQGGGTSGGGTNKGGRKQFATGGSFEVGGNGGPDTTPVFFWATRGEEVTITPPGGEKKNKSGGAAETNNYYRIFGNVQVGQMQELAQTRARSRLSLVK